MSREERLAARPTDPAQRDNRGGATLSGGVSPEYSDSEMREFGERLAALYVRRDERPSLELAEEISQIRGRMRRGPRLHAGEFLQDGRYRLISRRRSGSTDEHWRAWDRIRNEPVRIRVFHSAWVTDLDAVGAFVARGEALERLAHPGIGRILDANRSDEGFVYLALQVDDAPSSLSPEVEETADFSKPTLEPIDIVQATIEAAQALEYAHSQGVVHGDIRPFNILLNNDRSAQVVGFAVQPRAPTDGTASLFRAPEASEPGSRAPGGSESGTLPQPAGDVYALAMTAIAALYHGPLSVQVLRDPAPLVRALEVPEKTKAVLSRAIDWDLGVRYPTMRALIDDWLSDADLVRQLAARATELGRTAIAAEHLETLLSLEPRRLVEIRSNLGEMYLSLGQHDRALDHLLQALERSANVEELFDQLRVAGARTGQWPRIAETLWSQARVRDAGRRVILRMELARINEVELHDPAAAAESWSQVLADHRTPEQAEAALGALIRLAEARGDWTAAIAYGRELLSYVTGEARAQVEFGIGRVYLEQFGDEVRGLQYIDRAETAGYHELQLTGQLQGIRARRGEWGSLVRLMLAQAESQDLSEASPTLLRAGLIASAVHLEDDTTAVYSALLERAPRHVVALRHLARAAHRRRDRPAALAHYERLWEAYHGRDAEEPEASERAADCCAHARLLTEAGEVEEALIRLEEALRLNPNHVPSLRLSAPLHLQRGDVVRAAAVLERTMALFKTAEPGATTTAEVALGLGEVAWVQGRLAAAMGWYNRAIELEPGSALAWWGLAKVAFASRGGTPGADRAPWVGATPRKFTPYEGLARLFAGALDAAAMRAWLEATPLGRVVVENGDLPARLAPAVVDTLIATDQISSDLFTRLTLALPGWAAAISDIRAWWAPPATSLKRDAAAAAAAIRRSSDWSQRVVVEDVSTDEPRELLPPVRAAGGAPAPQVDATAPESWARLLANHHPSPPGPRPANAAMPPAEDPLPTGPVGALVRDGVLWVALRRAQEAVSIGSAETCDLRIRDDADVLADHARLVRMAGRVYLEAVGDAPLHVDGERRARWRLIGGERVTIGETRLQFQAFEDESALLALTPRVSPLPPAPPRASSPSRSVPITNPVVSEPRARLERAPPVAESPGMSLPAEPAPPAAPPESAWQSPPPPPPPPPTVTHSLPGPAESPPPLAAFDEPGGRPPRKTPPPARVPPRTPPPAPLHTLDPAILAAAAEADDAPTDVVFAPEGQAPPVRAENGIGPPHIPAVVLTDDFDEDEPSEGEVIQARRADGPGIERLSSSWLDRGAELEETFPTDLMTRDALEAALEEHSGYHLVHEEESPRPPAGPTLMPFDRQEVEGPNGSLEFMSGKERGKRVHVVGMLTIGQSQSCGIAIPSDLRLSAVHCRIERSREGFVLVDEGSANGTVVNGQRTTRCVLQGGEVIMVGRTVLRFRVER